MHRIDLNCDLGEGIGQEDLLMPFISSANVACGFHAGDAEVIRATVAAARDFGVAVGAHPGFADREHFGRREMQLPEAEVYRLVRVQIEALLDICIEAGVGLHHVKAHGALYNMVARDAALSAVIVSAIQDVDPRLIVYGLSGSALISEAHKAGLRTASEVFADRTYRYDGSLTPRADPGALIENGDQALNQALLMILEGNVISTSGPTIPIVAETLCLHGDGPHALEFARSIYEALKSRQVEITAP